MKERNTVVFIAMSLDGYIADANGGVDWLEGQNPEEGDGNIPTLLGSGIRLFDSLKGQTKLKLVRSQVYNGIAELVYERR